MKNIKTVILPAIILCVLCAVLTAILAGTNLLTRDTIAEKEAAKEAAALNSVIKDAQFETVLEEENLITYKATKSGETVGYAFKATQNGYGDKVSVIIGIADDKITAVEIIDVSGETPGLGQDAKKESYTKSLAGLSSTDTVPKIKTGATITSNAIKRAIESAFSKYEEVARK